MKLATFSAGHASRRLGAVLPGTDRMLDLQRSHYVRTGVHEGRLSGMQAMIAGGPAAWDLARSVLETAEPADTLALSSIKLHAPLEPVALRCCSVFEEHYRGCMRALARMSGQADLPAQIVIPALTRAIPAYCKGNHLNVAGPDDEVPWPTFGDNLDFELEVAAVIGKRGRDVSLQDAPSHIFGYTVFNDISARIPQLDEMKMGLGPAKSKDFDGANILGPFIVTRDEIDGDNLGGIARVNGREVGRSNSVEMNHDWAHIIAYRSFGETMHAGEVITCGAFPGCNGIEHLQFLQPGDVIELEVEGIGILRNRMGSRPPQPSPWPPILA